MAKESCCEHLADGEHTLLPAVAVNGLVLLPTVVACSGHCLLPVLGNGDMRLMKWVSSRTVLLYVKIVLKKLVQ